MASFFLFQNKKYEKYVFYILGASVIAYLTTGGLNPIFHQLKAYLFRESVSGTNDGLGLHFFNVMQTVREAGHIPFETFANRISGSVITFVLSLVGYGYLLYRHKIMLFSLPLVGLGFVAYVGGLRFTVYAVPVLAMGIAFLITEISQKMPTKKLQYLSSIAFTLLILLPNYFHIQGYKVPTVFNADEVKVLESLRKKAQPKDYAVAWWDYGFPIRYYAHVHTLADGAQHSGDRNFPVSYVLTHPQEESAKMARLDVEYDAKKLETNASTSLIEQMTKDYGFNDTNDFLLSLQTDIKLPKKTRDVYLYLPYRMLNIYPTVTLFSNLDLMSGKPKKQPFFYVARGAKDTGNKILLGNGIAIDKTTSSLVLGKKKMPIRRFVKTAYDKKGELHVSTQLLDFSAQLSVIYMSNYGVFLIVDEQTYNATYVQLFVLEHYDKSLYEQVILSPSVKIYKLKI
jgi:dolichyl-diphosphooligosaccharide--protein glycosyltransferase/undecaprenyl-diphosphooligosaccharide--protein glycosyltransferase